MARYIGIKNGVPDVTIVDADGDSLIVRNCGRKGQVALSVVSKGETNGPAVEVSAEWLMKAVVEVMQG
jgi:hypothetical protein